MKASPHLHKPQAPPQTAIFAPGRAQLSQGQRLLIQPKLVLGPIDDPFEREADHIASQVMRMPAPRRPSVPGRDRSAVNARPVRREKSRRCKPSLPGSWGRTTRGIGPERRPRSAQFGWTAPGCGRPAVHGTAVRARFQRDSYPHGRASRAVGPLRRSTRVYLRITHRLRGRTLRAGQRQWPAPSRPRTHSHDSAAIGNEASTRSRQRDIRSVPGGRPRQRTAGGGKQRPRAPGGKLQFLDSRGRQTGSGHPTGAQHLSPLWWLFAGAKDQQF